MLRSLVTFLFLTVCVIAEARTANIPHRGLSKLLAIHKRGSPANTFADILNHKNAAIVYSYAEHAKWDSLVKILSLEIDEHDDLTKESVLSLLKEEQKQSDLGLDSLNPKGYVVSKSKTGFITVHPYEVNDDILVSDPTRYYEVDGKFLSTQDTEILPLLEKQMTTNDNKRIHVESGISELTDSIDAIKKKMAEQQQEVYAKLQQKMDEQGVNIKDISTYDTSSIHTLIETAIRQYPHAGINNAEDFLKSKDDARRVFTLIDKDTTKLDGKFIKHARGEYVLTDTEFKEVCYHTPNNCYLLSPTGETTLSDALKIERVLLKHEDLKKIYGEDYIADKETTEILAQATEIWKKYLLP